ncbi:MAG: hypothetical protein KME40_16110 [Komarekiella atlantica HA4396-MV6]|nr:hypothetical protein [Komarekiella atlantica HA4396-MV6]
MGIGNWEDKGAEEHSLTLDPCTEAINRVSTLDSCTEAINRVSTLDK